MKIWFVSATDLEGGAGRAAYRLHRGMPSVGVESHMLVLKKASADPNIGKFPGALGRWLPSLNYRIDPLPLRRYPDRQPLRVWSLNWFPYPVSGYLNHLPADLLHLHWIGAGFIPIRALARVHKPIVWTMHDEWAYTGGCHYSYDCNRFTGMCGACPQLGSTREADLSRSTWQSKRDHWRKLNLTIVSPSHWIADQARKSSLFADTRIEVIPNGIDASVYQPGDRQAARDRLKLPQDKRLILFVSANANDYRKGFHLLQGALAQLSSRDDFELVILGEDPRTDGSKLGLKAHYLGVINDEAALAAVYSAADVFVAPSLQENLPNTIMEALACGTPCVAFRIGGIPDMIEHQRNGYLVKPYEIDDLARGIVWVLDDEDRLVQLRARARQKVEAEFELTHIAQRHKALYEEVAR